MLKELEQVIRLLESQQPGACLAYIESIEASHPNCACLIKAKISIYREDGRWDDVLPLAEQFYRQEPDNPTAAAEYAVALIIAGQVSLAFSTLVDAFERGVTGREPEKPDTIHSALLQSALQVAGFAAVTGRTIPAVAIGNVLKEIPAVAEKANVLLFRITSQTDVPIMLRDWAFDFDCPAGFPGKEIFEEAAVLVRMMCWKQALTLLESLTPHANAWPEIWRNIATVRFWLLQNEQACEALKQYISLPNTLRDDAVDAEMMRMYFTPGYFGDQLDVMEIEYPISDAEKALERMLSAPILEQVSANISSMEIKPKSCFVLLDRPFSDSTTLTLDNVSAQLAVVLLFGKETDRDARLAILELREDERELIENKLREILGDLIEIPGKVMNQHAESKTMLLMDHRFSLDANTRLSIADLQKITEDYFTTTFTESWLSIPLACCEGKTAVEASKESKYEILLLAAIQSIESNLDNKQSRFASNIRSKLGLPEPEVILVPPSADEQHADGDFLSALDFYPVWRWHRFDVKPFSTQLLASGMQVAFGMQAYQAAAHFAEELLAKPMDSIPFPVRLMAFESLIAYAQSNRDIDQALLWVERGRSETDAQGLSDAAWYLHKVSLHLIERNHPAFSEAVNHLLTNYREDADVMASLQELFIQIGLFNADGTPTAAWLAAQEQAKQQPEEPSLWTPDAGTPSATPAKLWVPD